MINLSFPKITEDVKHHLITYARAHKMERRLSLRAQIILDWMNGETYKVSRAKNGVTETVIAKWRKRFFTAGLEGLADAPRSGTAHSRN